MLWSLQQRLGLWCFFVASVPLATAHIHVEESDNLCGVYEGPACASLTVNSSSFLDVRQTWLPNGTFLEEGLWAPGRCKVSSVALQGVVLYRLRGRFRDHGSASIRDPSVRKMIVDVHSAKVTLLSPRSDILSQWRVACPCNGYGWQALKEVDALKQCEEASCPPFSPGSLFLWAMPVAPNGTSGGSLCVSPRRSFHEPWPSRQVTNFCMDKEADMQCSWRAPRDSLKLSATSWPTSFSFPRQKSLVKSVNTIPVESLRSNLSLYEDGVLEEIIEWGLGGLPGQHGHFRTVAKGRWYNHGEHVFLPGLAKLRFETTSVEAWPSSGASTQICLDEGCADPAVVLRLLCPCGQGAWGKAAAQGTAVDLMHCFRDSPDARCQLSPLFPREAFVLGGTSSDGLCLSVRSEVRHAGWGVSQNSFVCGGPPSAVRRQDRQPRAESTPAQDSQEQETQSSASSQYSQREAHHKSRRQQREEAARKRSERQAKPQEGGVDFFESAGFAGRSGRCGSEGRCKPSAFGIDAIRSLRIPRGWRVDVMTPLGSNSVLLHDEGYPVLRTLLFDMPNLTDRLRTARPWLQDEDFLAFERNLSLGVFRYDASAQGAQLRVDSCGADTNTLAGSKEDDVLVLSLFGESNQQFDLPQHEGGVRWRSLQVDEGFHATVDPSKRDGPLAEAIGLSGRRACVDLARAPKTVHLQPDCSALNNCSGHGFCRKPKTCTCRINDGWTGERCDVQFPDGSSSIICESVVAFVGSPLSCVLHSRRNFLPASASPEVAAVVLSRDAQHLGRLQMDALAKTQASNATLARFTFWPKKTIWDFTQLFQVETQFAFLSDLKRMFITPVRIEPRPQLECSCKPRLEEDEGHFSCQILVRPRVGGSAAVPVPLKLFAVSTSGGYAERLRCVKQEVDGGALCTQAAIYIVATAVELAVTVELKAPVEATADVSSGTSVAASCTATLAGPERPGAAERLLQRVEARPALAALGLPVDLAQRFWGPLALSACAKTVTTATDANGWPGPWASLEAAQTALDSHDAAGALRSVGLVRRMARACARLGQPNLPTAEPVLRGSGIRAAVEWRLLGYVEDAARTASACILRSDEGDVPGTASDLCRLVSRQFRKVKAAVRQLNTGVVGSWTSALANAKHSGTWAAVLDQVTEAEALLPKTWGAGLDSEGAATAQRWLLELKLAACFGQVDAFNGKVRAGHKLTLTNATRDVCSNATAVVELAEKDWPQAGAFSEEKTGVWKVRIILLLAEAQFAAGQAGEAMREVFRGMSLADFEGDEYERLNELFRRIRDFRDRKRRQERSNFGDDWTNDLFKDEKDKFYEVLGVARNSTDAEVKKAYRQLALKWHPDKHPDNKEEAEQMFLSITEAYEAIMADSERRRKQAAGKQTEPANENSETDEASREQEDGQGKDEESEANTTEASDSTNKDSGKTGSRNKRGSRGQTYEEDDGGFYDPLSHVPLPRHCCLPGRLNSR